MVADTPDAWVHALRSLLEDRDQLARLAANALANIVAGSLAPQVADFWVQALVDAASSPLRSGGARDLAA
jgi:hypothetical protein